MGYLEINNDYYSHSKLKDDLYSHILPNEEESLRFSAIVNYLARTCAIIREDTPTPRILDIGSGRGWLTNLIAPFGLCEGIEPAGQAVEFARKQFPHLNFFEGTLDTLKASVTFEKYDVIVCSEVIEHVPNQLKPTFIQQISDCLKPGGSCILTTPRGELFRSWSRSGVSPQPIEDWLTENEIAQSFSNAGFHAVEHTRVRPRNFSPRLSLAQNTKLRRVMSLLGLDLINAGLDYSASIYQVWWFRNKSQSIW